MAPAMENRMRKLGPLQFIALVSAAICALTAPASRAQDGFPPRLAEALLHIILSHHGTLEHGSPVVPCTREATLVHFLDNLGGRLGSFDRLQKELPVGASWSSFDRALGTSAFFGAVEDAPPRLEAA